MCDKNCPSEGEGALHTRVGNIDGSPQKTQRKLNNVKSSLKVCPSVKLQRFRKGLNAFQRGLASPQNTPHLSQPLPILSENPLLTTAYHLQWGLNPQKCGRNGAVQRDAGHLWFTGLPDLMAKGQRLYGFIGIVTFH